MYEYLLIAFGVVLFIASVCFIVNTFIDTKARIGKKLKIRQIIKNLKKKQQKKAENHINTEQDLELQNVELQDVNMNGQNILFTNPEKPDSNDNDSAKNNDDEDTLFIVD